MKTILRCPADEEKWCKLEQLCAAVRIEIERVEAVYLNSEKDIEQLELAVLACKTPRGDEVGPGFEPIPAGCCLLIGEQSTGTNKEVSRTQTAELVRSHHVGSPLSVKFRPMGTSRQSPLSPFAKHLMKTKHFDKVVKGRSAQELRDLLLIG